MTGFPSYPLQCLKHASGANWRRFAPWNKAKQPAAVTNLSLLAVLIRKHRRRHGSKRLRNGFAPGARPGNSSTLLSRPTSSDSNHRYALPAGAMRPADWPAAHGAHFWLGQLRHGQQSSAVPGAVLRRPAARRPRRPSGGLDAKVLLPVRPDLLPRRWRAERAQHPVLVMPAYTRAATDAAATATTPAPAPRPPAPQLPGRRARPRRRDAARRPGDHVASASPSTFAALYVLRQDTGAQAHRMTCAQATAN